jgi:hypothetical protein
MRWSSGSCVLASLVLLSSRANAQAPEEPTAPRTPPPVVAPTEGQGTTRPPPPGPVTAQVTAQTPPPDDEDDAGDEGVMTFKATRNMDMQRFAESSQQELKVAGARARYALNLFGDMFAGASSRSEGDIRRPDPAFAVGVFDMLFTADLEKQLLMTSEFSVRYEPHTPLAELERLHIRWRPSKHFFLEAGRFHTDLGYWNVAYHHGRYLQLTNERPRTILLHGGLLPAHWIGAQAGVTATLGRGTVTAIGSVGTARERQPRGGHGLHGSAFTSINAVHGKLELAGYLHRDLRFGVSAVYDTIPAEPAFVRPGLPDQEIVEKVGNAFIALPSVPVIFISEAYVIEHSLNRSARPENVGSKWRTFGAFALLGYQFGRVTPYIRGEYIGSEVGAFIFNPFYHPEPRSISGFSVTMDVKEGVVGTRIDVSDWSSLKFEYHATAGVGTRRADLPTPMIHTGIASWSFGI